MGPLPSFLNQTCKVHSYSHGCSSSAASVTPRIMTVQYKFCWTLKSCHLITGRRGGGAGQELSWWEGCLWKGGRGKEYPNASSGLTECETEALQPLECGSASALSSFPGEGRSVLRLACGLGAGVRRLKLAAAGAGAGRYPPPARQAPLSPDWAERWPSPTHGVVVGLKWMMV